MARDHNAIGNCSKHTALEKFDNCTWYARRDHEQAVIEQPRQPPDNGQVLSLVDLYHLITGAGQTTTISKIAADLIYRQKKKVALVSLDTFRVGGIEQLQIYGDIMGIPVETAQDNSGLEECVKRHSDKDVILIDTMGRCHKDHDYSAQLSKIFEGLDEIETHLVLSAVSNEKQFMKSYKQFSPLEINRVLFTKIDEGLNFGSVVNFSLRTRLPLSYLTTGQRVPEDIEVAVQDRVIRLIFN